MIGPPSSLRGIARRWLALYVPVAALILGLSTLVGFLLGDAIPVDSLPAGSDAGSNPFLPSEITTVSIAVNNLTAMGVMLLGAVSLGLVTVLGLVLNGLLIGVVVGLAGQELPSMVILALLLPHGIVEIPALLIVAAIGLRFGRLTVRYLRGTEDRLVTEQALREAGWLVGVACVLVLVAAYIEANVTLAIAERVADGSLSGLPSA
ncbi:stage II sporulation protein M [Haloarcula pelagica]|uniref:stage II sporulation protein M n=1 Tax=Haloarcula pelagica TaxID=3033389 RepID=UPI0024C29E43|nr:stage II sporulation protein M [Halomicroarcula sp. YJ-61-S]